MSNKKAKNRLIRKILRHENYLLEKENSRKYLYYGFEDEIYRSHFFEVYNNLKSKQESEYKYFLFQAMYLALNDLKKLNPYWYKLICEFYFGKEKITLEQLGKMHNVTRQAVTKSLRRALNVLRQIAEEYLENMMK